MKKSEQNKQGKIQLTNEKIFPVPFSLGEINENIIITTNASSKMSKEEITNKAIKFHSQGNIVEASRYYQLFLDQGFSDPIIFSNYGAILKDLKNLQKAEILMRKAIELKPDFAEAYCNLGNIYEDLGKLEEAELLTRKAIKLKPDFENAYFNLGNLLQELGRLEESEISLRKAIEINPDYVEAHFNLASICLNLSKLEEAKISYKRVIELDPNYAVAHAWLGRILIKQSKNDLAIQYLSKCCCLLREDRKNNPDQLKSFGMISKAKIDHDIEQFDYLVSQGIDTKKFTELGNLYRKVASEINWPSETKVITLTGDPQRLLRDSYNLLIHRAEAPSLTTSALNDSLNVDKITTHYFDHDFGLTYIDDFLSPKALDSLRKFLLESTIWFSIKNNGYLGAFLKEGFANPLILQISEELQKKFPRILKNHSLNEVWAFKYGNPPKGKISQLRGINVHADFAAINVNFWITPSEANLNPKSGGMVVYDVEAPKEWNFNTYNTDENKIRDELKKSKGQTKVIPYKGNRAVLFNSNLFHETDTYEFKEGYENRRINVTMLFGMRNG